MGGGSYSEPVRSSSYGSSGGGGDSRVSWSPPETHSTFSEKAMSKTREVPETDPKREIVSTSESLVVVAFDVTGSNVDQAKIFRDKLPMFYGQIIYPGLTIEQIHEVEAGKRAAPQPYLDDFEVCFAVGGDANGDEAPLQVGNPGKGIQLSALLEQLYLEGGGGDGTMETYELLAHYFANRCRMPKVKWPFFLLFADEAPYPILEREHVLRHMGIDPGDDIDTKKVFEDLIKVFKNNVFILLRRYAHGDSTCVRGIRRQWLEALGEGHSHQIIDLDPNDERSIVDVELGVIALVSGKRDLLDYLQDMMGKEQTDERIESVRRSLDGLSRFLTQTTAPLGKATTARGSGARRT